jgi:uncharacterized membrane-anchored protein YitT (DUF2179 family)
MHNKTVLAAITDWSFTLLGILFATFALKSLLVPNGFLDGGVTGMSLLLHELYHIPLSVIILVANIPFIVMSGYQISKPFAWKTFISIIILGISLQFLPLPDITSRWQSNMVIVALFGGFFLGLGIGLGMRGGCAIDGIEILAIYTRKRIGLTMSEIILGINVLIFLIAALVFGLEKSFYAMLTYYVATRTIDYVVEGIEEYTGVTIISGQSEVIKEKLAREMGRGITVYKGERGFMKKSFEVSHDCDIVFTVVTRLEVRKLRSIIHEIDPKAFVFTGTIKETSGGILKHMSGHHE